MFSDKLQESAQKTSHDVGITLRYVLPLLRIDAESIELIGPTVPIEQQVPIPLGNIIYMGRFSSWITFIWITS
ncbi:MAG: hypothetical protein ACUVXI_19015 [bacterium]